MKKTKSIQFRFAVLFIVVFVAIYLGSYAFITKYLDRYYFRTKINAMLDVYDDFLTLTNETGDEQADNKPEIVVINGNAIDKNENIDEKSKEFGIVIDDNSDIREYADLDYKTIERYSRAILEVEKKTGISVIIQLSRDRCLSSYNVNTNWMMKRLLNLRMKNSFADHKSDRSIIAYTKSYCLQYNNEAENDTNYLDMWGSLPEGVWFLMSMPMERIQESSKIASRFYLYIGAAGLLVGCILIVIVMHHATKPIRELTKLSKKMTDLCFEAKYHGETESELGILGQNMNEMSNRLEMTMQELQNANLELKNDIEKKTELEKQRSEFISNVSHELKTPIALIQGYAEGLQEGLCDDPDSRKAYCDVIMDEAKKMNRLVLQLLSLNQLEAGEQQIDITRFDITELLRGAVSSQELLMKQNNTYIVLKPEKQIFVWGDEYLVEEVIANYLSNAWNHLSGKKQIVVDAVAINDKIRVSVFNTGKQIPKEDINRIWEKFYKVDKARTRAYGGHGIGLSIVKVIMDRLGGSCGVENVTDGVCFWFELPGKIS